MSLWVIYDVKSTSNKWVWWLKFKISWNDLWMISEVWVQFTNEKWAIERQSLKIQKDWEYMVAYSGDSCKNCKDFKPYYTIWWATNVASADESWKEEENNYTEEEYVYKWEEETKEENQQDWEVEIASSTYWADFSWMIYILWFWKSLFSFKQKVVDIKEKYGEWASILISLIPAVWEWYDILTLLWMKDPITGEKLTKLATGLTLIWLLSGFGSWSAARKAWEEALAKLTEDLWAWLDEITRIATNYFNWFEFSTVDWLINNAKYFNIDNFKAAVKKEAVSGWVKATSSNYGKLFWTKYWKKLDGFQVHHSLPQKYEEMFSKAGINIHEDKYLRWVKSDNPNTHAIITKEWYDFDKLKWWKPTLDDIKKFANDIDKKYKNDFIYVK